MSDPNSKDKEASQKRCSLPSNLSKLRVNASESDPKTSQASNLATLPFDSEVFKPLVGLGDIHTFAVHKTILCKSPVFERMCCGDFLEAHSKTIKLPDDDAHNMGQLLQFLYGNKQAASKVDGEDCAYDGGMLLELYVLADKYEVLAFRQSIIKRLDDLDFPSESPLEFFTLLTDFYSQIAHSDDIFWSFFKKTTKSCLKKKSRDDLVFLAGLLLDHEMLLARVFTSLANVKADLELKIKQLGQKNTDLKAQKSSEAITVRRIQRRQ